MSNFTISSVPRISREELSTLVRAKSPTLAIIDVRDSDYIGGHIVGCLNVPTHTHDYKIPELVRTLQDKETVVFHCALSQQRGPSSALKYLRERERLLDAEAHKKNQGVGDAPEVRGQTVYILDGGFVQWQELYVLSIAPNVAQCSYRTQLWRRQRSHRRLPEGHLGVWLLDHCSNSSCLSFRNEHGIAVCDTPSVNASSIGSCHYWCSLFETFHMRRAIS